MGEYAPPDLRDSIEIYSSEDRSEKSFLRRI